MYHGRPDFVVVVLAAFDLVDSLCGGVSCRVFSSCDLKLQQCNADDTDDDDGCGGRSAAVFFFLWFSFCVLFVFLVSVQFLCFAFSR